MKMATNQILLRKMRLFNAETQDNQDDEIDALSKAITNRQSALVQEIRTHLFQTVRHGDQITV